MGRLHFSASLWLIVDGGAVSIAALQRLPAMGRIGALVDACTCAAVMAGVA